MDNGNGANATSGCTWYQNLSQCLGLKSAVGERRQQSCLICLLTVAFRPPRCLCDCYSRQEYLLSVRRKCLILRPQGLIIALTPLINLRVRLWLFVWISPCVCPSQLVTSCFIDDNNCLWLELCCDKLPNTGCLTLNCPVPGARSCYHEGGKSRTWSRFLFVKWAAAIIPHDPDNSQQVGLSTRVKFILFVKRRITDYNASVSFNKL